MESPDRVPTTPIIRLSMLRQSFQAKLMLMLLLPILAIWSVVLFVSASMLQRQQNFVGEQQVSAATLQAADLNEKIGDRFAVLAGYASGLDARRLSEPGYATDYLRHRSSLTPLFSGGAVIFDRAGTALGDFPVVPGRTGAHYADREFLQRLFATGKATISQPFVGRPVNGLRMSMCVPIAGASEAIVGALCGNFDMRSNNFLGRLSDQTTMGNNGFFLIRTSDRLLIASTDRRRLMAPLPDTPLVQQLIMGKGNAFVANNVDGVEKLYASVAVPVAGWALVLGLPTKIAYAPVRTSVLELKLAALAASLLVIVSAFLLTRRMVRPILRAGLRMDAMSSGREALQHVDETGDSEIRGLLTSFNRLSDSVIRQQTELHQERNALLVAKDALRQLNQELETKVAQRSHKLLELNALLNEVLEMLPFGVLVLNRQQQVTLRNKLIGTLLSYPDATQGAMPLQFEDWLRFTHARGDFPDETLDEVLQRHRGYMEARQPVCFERQQGNGLYLEIRSQPLENQWTLLTYTDITAHKQAEQALHAALSVAEAATIAKGAFIANVSHEIRTPMNAILGLSYLLEGTALPDDAHDMVVKMRMAGTSLLGILNDVLDFSKIDSGKLDIQSSPFRLGDVLDNLATIMSASAQEKDLELIIAATPDGTGQLIGDSLRLEQVLINLAGNAIKFTEQGRVALAIRKVFDKGDTVGLRFSVHDTGIGIALDKQTDIFSEFSQADGWTSRKYGGTGLGLTISRRLVAAMGGELHISSALGHGSEFWFELRFQRAQDTWVATPEMACLSVLIADDNAVAREALHGVVDALGWTAATFTSGDDAVAHLAAQQADSQPHDVLLLDYKMPGKNGLQTAQAARHTFADGSKPIVILVTAFTSRALLHHPQVELADAILHKPVTSSALYNAVSRAMQARNGSPAQRPGHVAMRLAGLRLLVVDDSELNCEVAKRIFAAEGAQVAQASNGQQAVDWLHVHGATVDVVLMDVQMPVLNGYEATREIRRLPALANLPIVALTAGAFVDQQALASEAGMNGFLSKPFDVEAAIALIRDVTNYAVRPAMAQHEALRASA